MDASTGQSGPEGRKFSLLDSVGAVFAHNENERQNRLAKQRSKQQAELEHSRYLRTILPPNELARAKSVVNQWAKKHGTKCSTGNFNRPASPRSLLRTRAAASPARPRVEMTALSSPSRSRSPAPSRSPLTRVRGERDVIVISDDESGMESMEAMDEEAQINLAIQRSLEEAGVESSDSPTATGQLDFISLDISSDETSLNTAGEVIETAPSSEAGAPQCLRCPVLECEMRFSSAARLAEHCAVLRHSPCDPALLLTDGCLPESQSGTMCPYCLKVFTEEAGCLSHKCPKFGDAPFSGIAIGGFMCPQCLMIEQDEASCADHIATLKHTSYSLPFTEDFLSLQVMPVPVSPGFAQHFAAQCRSVDFSLYCADCSSEVAADHTQSHPDHIVSASASNDLLDVFMEYLCSCQCERCWMIFAASEASVGDVHACGRGEEGAVRSTNVRSFSELLRFLGLRHAHSSVRSTLRRPFAPVTASPLEQSTSSSVQKKQSSEPFTSTSSIFKKPSAEPLTSTSKQCRHVVLSSSEKRLPKRTVALSNHRHSPHTTRYYTQPTNYAPDDLYNRRLYEQRLFTHSRFHDSNSRWSSGGNRRFGSHRYFDHREARSHLNRNQAKNSHSKGRSDLKSAAPAAPSNSGFGSTTFHPPSGVPSLRSTDDFHVPAQVAPPSADVLSTMKLLIFLDLDNWQSFFKRLPRCLPDLTFVWAFYGGATVWREPNGFCAYTEQKMKGLFHLNKKSGRTKDAADLSLVLQVGAMNVLLPKTVPFTILSGDKAFRQLEQDLQSSERRLVVIDPHLANKQSADLFYTQIISVFQS